MGGGGVARLGPVETLEKLSGLKVPVATDEFHYVVESDPLVISKLKRLVDLKRISCLAHRKGAFGPKKPFVWEKGFTGEDIPMPF